MATFRLPAQRLFSGRHVLGVSVSSCVGHCWCICVCFVSVPSASHLSLSPCHTFFRVHIWQTKPPCAARVHVVCSWPTHVPHTHVLLVLNRSEGSRYTAPLHVTLPATHAYLPRLSQSCAHYEPMWPWHLEFSPQGHEVSQMAMCCVA